uniref:Uncharacterized protein n=1 Tax=Arundo donax TaxID=35708 RepID=A0A0A9C7F0_ARUDO
MTTLPYQISLFQHLYICLSPKPPIHNLSLH